MPAYTTSSRALAGRYNIHKMFWTNSTTGYNLSADTLDGISGAAAGHIHFHLNTALSHTQVWILKIEGWEDITDRYHDRYTEATLGRMVPHPRFKDLFLTVTVNGTEPIFILADSYRTRIRKRVPATGQLGANTASSS